MTYDLSGTAAAASDTLAWLRTTCLLEGLSTLDAEAFYYVRIRRTAFRDVARIVIGESQESVRRRVKAVEAMLRIVLKECQNEDET